MREDNEVYEIDLIELFGSLLHRWWVIFISAVVCAAIALGVTLEFITPMYQTSVMLYVNNSSLTLGATKVNLTQGDIAASQSLVETYGVILKSSLTLKDLANSLAGKVGLHKEYDYKQLRKMITSENANDTEIMKITVTCDDYDDAVIIANTIADVLPKRILKIVDGTSVTVVDLAEYPETQSSPSYTKNTAIGFAAGFILACAAVVIYDMFIHDTIDNPEYLSQAFGGKIPVLANIPAIDDASGKSYMYSKSGYNGNRYYNRYNKKYYKHGYGYGYGYGYGKKRKEEVKSDDKGTDE